MWHLFAPSLLFLPILHVKCSFEMTDCQWRAVVNSYDNLGGDRNIFYQQTYVSSVADVFRELVDSAIDIDDKNAHYFGFPYYLKIDLECKTQNSEKATRMGHYTGLYPVVTVAFQEPVNAVFQKQEVLEIEMKAAPYKYGDCDAEEVCKMCWYVPMPSMNGSVMLYVLVEGSSVGVQVDDKRFVVNINGFVSNQGLFKIGTKLTNLKNFMSLQDGSRPLWYTHRNTPVLILGGVPNSKVILVSDTEFDDFYPIEVGIDSCWIGSLSCPQDKFSSSIVDTIATESTLFIRQNQLVYYFTGSYKTLYMKNPGSELWTRILNNVCVKKLCPVHFHKNDTEYVIALGGGWQEGEFFMITCKDGIVNVSKSLKDRTIGNKTVCGLLKSSRCNILWAVLNTHENIIVVLVQDTDTNATHVVLYFRETGKFERVYEIPRFVPMDSEKGFVILLGLEKYTNTTLVPRGLAFNPFRNNLYIWGNIIFQSKDMHNYLYLSNFPKTSFIKNFVLSYHGEFACVTDDEKIWVSIEGGSDIKQVYPSKAWDVYSMLQVMDGRYDYGHPHGLVTIFYDREGLKELVYIKRPDGTEKLIKRPFPVGSVLTYDKMIHTAYKVFEYEEEYHIKFSHSCPFAVMHVVDLPLPQRFTRVEHYFTEPPDIMEKTGFHDSKSLAVYQGLVFQLLWLHSDYNRPYADPVHDPTWRWWKNKKQDSEYYYYIASNRNSSGGVYVDMVDYVKLYRLKPQNVLPRIIYLDKNTAYTFQVYLSIRTTKQSIGETAEENSLNSVWLTVLLSHPEYVQTKLRRQELISRGAVLYEVSILDTGLFPRQDLSGKNLLKTSIIIKVARSGMNCHHYTDQGPELKGANVVGVNVGCPPGKRLAFDITGTLELNKLKNKRYFDCVKKDPEMPCFFFSDVFYPLFLIQDMVTGDSGPFQGSYILKIIGGGAYTEANIRYFSEKEIDNYNIPQDGESLIWLKASFDEDNVKGRDPEGYHVFSHNRSGILWVCEKNSPCYDVSPRGLVAPHYYFVIKVSNRGVDETTYCDYALEFTIHIHGLRLSPTRAIYLLQVSIGITVGALVLYILVYVLAPKVKAFASKTMRRFEEALAARVESSLTFSSSFTSQGSLHNFPSSSSDTPSQKVTKGNPEVPHHGPQ